MDRNHHVIHYQAIDNSNVDLILCETLCLLRVFCGYIKWFRFFYHKGLKEIHKDHEDYMCLYFKDINPWELSAKH